VENRFWVNLCELFGVPEYGPLQYDDDRREEIVDFLRKTFKTKTLDEWTEVLGQRDVCWGKVQNMSEALNDQLFAERGMVAELRDGSTGSSTALGIPIKLSDTPGSLRTPPVEFGESTRKILEELGYTEAEADHFFENGAV
jgi:crotonobetainyl-CoA:carnitine CoA-transferase CaiB-like acyl-CoA transferase